MIHILKNKVEEKIEIKIENRGGCELLSNTILEVLNEYANLHKKKASIIDYYLELSKKLNYPYFYKAYILNYFTD